MKNFRRLSVFAAVLMIFTGGISFHPKTNVSEVKYQAKNVTVSIKGTSSLHDWEMKSNTGNFDALINISNDKVAFSRLSSCRLPGKRHDNRVAEIGQDADFSCSYRDTRLAVEAVHYTKLKVR